MLRSIFKNPARLFLCITIIVAFGIYSGFTLPISMYPATSKPTVQMWIPYGTYSSAKFRDEYGETVESRIQSISNSQAKVEDLNVYYEENGVYFDVEFEWGTTFDTAKSEIDSIAASTSAMLPKDISDRISVWQRNNSAGFLAASIYSEKMSLKDLYEKIKPILQPQLDKVQDAEFAIIWNPDQYSINVKLNPDKLAHYGIFPSLVTRQISDALYSYSGSNIKFGDKTQKFEISAPINTAKDLGSLSIQIGDKLVLLKDLAEVEYGKDLHRERSFKTNGVSSLILFARPKSGANVKQMSEDIMQVLSSNKDHLPKSLSTRIIVDPANAINKSIINLIKDVFVAAIMAVIVLYLFIGGIKNVGTAAIEIPLSMIISFITMKYVGMNLNLISLGGLALAAGMNVDASVVILENIFKHRELRFKQGLSCETLSERLDLVYMAVKEVALPVILSITTTLIVFIPMAFTSDLTNAVLGDLARAVIFSHAISGFVALIIVPTVRIIMLKNYKETKAPLDKPFKKFETFYEKLLTKILGIKNIKYYFVITPLVLVFILSEVILPKLPKEVIGEPGSDWVSISLNAYDTKSGRHMDNIMQEAESKVLNLLGDKIQYTWLERNSKNNGQLMFRVANRSETEEIEKLLKKEFKNTPTRYYSVYTWNPASLPLPREKHFTALVKGDKDEIFETASRLTSFIKEKNYFGRVRTNPSIDHNFALTFFPYTQQIQKMNQNGYPIKLGDIADISMISESPRSLGGIDFENTSTEIKLSLNDKRYTELENLKSYPLNFQGMVIPLSAIGQFKSIKSPSTLYVHNSAPQIQIDGILDENKDGWEERLKSIEATVKNNLAKIIGDTQTTVEMTYPQPELQNALFQLSKSLLFSIGLIFFILWMQFQSVKQVLIIMMTVPLGIIGVLISLYIFGSYLSLNSALGIILLNGITVNNSILLTEVTNSLKEKGLKGKELILTATKKRLRPIIITSLTTILGMFPVALGLGDGGKILQPLGIAVTCGLFVATGLTLFIVPSLLLSLKEESKLSKVMNPSDEQSKVVINVPNKQPNDKGVPLQ